MCYNLQDIIRQAVDSGELLKNERPTCQLTGWGQHVEYPEPDSESNHSLNRSRGLIKTR
jgi:hypothetical protein